MAKTYTNIATFTSGQILTATQMNQIGDTLDNTTIPATCGAYHNTTQSINNAASTAVVFNTEWTNWDTDTIHSTSTNTSRFTVTTPGIYLVSCSITWAANATGYRELNFRIDGTNYAGSVNQLSTGGGTGTNQTLSTMMTFAGTEYIEAVVYQNSGGALNLTADAPASGTACRMSVTWLGKLT